MQWFLIVVMSFLLVGCGGGGSSAAIPTEPVANSAPVITDPGSLGVPGGATDVVAISATDADADTLSFSIVSGDDQRSTPPPQQHRCHDASVWHGALQQLQTGNCQATEPANESFQIPARCVHPSIQICVPILINQPQHLQRMWQTELH